MNGLIANYKTRKEKRVLVLGVNFDRVRHEEGRTLFLDIDNIVELQFDLLFCISE